jgi:hypothetical protein
MKTLVCLGALVLVSVGVQAQSPVKKDVMKILGEVPPPPPSAKDAYRGVTCEESAGKTVTCTAAKKFEAVDAALKDIETSYKAQEAEVKAAVPPGMSPEMARRAQDPEFKKKMKGMSKEEKMKMAMEMMNSGQVTPPTVEPEPAAVKSALDEVFKMNGGTQAEYTWSVAAQEADQKAAEEDHAAHAQVAAWEGDAIAKLPRISSGEMSAPDPAQVNIVRLKAIDRHIGVADRYLAQISKEWLARKAHITKRYAVFHEKLVASDYAARAKNVSTRKLLSDAQMTLFTSTGALVQQSRTAYEKSAYWVALRRQVEQQ